MGGSGWFKFPTLKSFEEKGCEMYEAGRVGNSSSKMWRRSGHTLYRVSFLVSLGTLAATFDSTACENPIAVAPGVWQKGGAAASRRRFFPPPPNSVVQIGALMKVICWIGGTSSVDQ
ncbi:hypothetical protein CHUAL_013414 [Chamberlinius hualienensis]